AIGIAGGENRAVEAAQQAIHSPILDIGIQGARGVLFNITGSRTLGLREVHMAAQVIAEVVDPDAEVIFGTAIDPNMGDEVKITVIATGFVVDHAQTIADERIRQLRIESLEQVADTELPTFLRRSMVQR
ncbi:MAG TPA: cell division protein FtsZ, partial [Dehalococcoidia bacterium]|nr:cell division protein FtsZ [Dehalococcoidia bacterium]